MTSLKDNDDLVNINVVQIQVSLNNASVSLQARKDDDDLANNNIVQILSFIK